MKYSNKIINFGNKKSIIKKLFNDVSKNYNKMNDLMSLGMHRAWKNDMIEQLKGEKAKIILDLAGGTGDVALKLAKKFKDSRIIVYDLSENMILESKKKLFEYKNRIEQINGSAEQIAIEDNSIDLITLSFGLRNFSNIEESIRECYRVLKYGKKIFCLEFSPSFSNTIKPFYDLYSYKIIPLLGKKVAKNEEAYIYLSDSIRNFPHNRELKRIFTKNGFFCYNNKKYLGGIAYLNTFCKV